MNKPNSNAERQWRVVKYGGSSIANPENWPHIVKRVRSIKQKGFHVIVVVSALRGINDLLQAHINAGPGASASELVNTLEQRHRNLLAALGLPAATLDKPFGEIRTLLESFGSHSSTPPDQARLLACGEYLSSKLTLAALNASQIDSQWLDSARVLTCGREDRRSRRARFLSARITAEPDPQLTDELADAGQVWVMPGFSAADAWGRTVLLGRGGSDTSATSAAAVVGARRVDIFSDVPGLFSAAPRRITGARLLRQIGFREAQELAAMGARALHPAALSPAILHNIEIHMHQTDRPDIEGTRISRAVHEHGSQVKAIVERKPITLISLEGMGMWQEVGFLAAIFGIFGDMGLSVDQVSTSESNVTVTLDPGANVLDQNVLDDLSRRLSRLCQVDIFSDCATVSLVGLGIRTILHKIGPALEVFEQRRILQVSQAANDLNLSFVVESRHADRLIAQLHQQLIPGGTGGDSVFGPTCEQLFGNASAASPAPPWWRQQTEQLLNLMDGKNCAYVYHLPTARQACRQLLGLDAVNRVLYSMKANSHPRLLRAVVDEGLGIECVSLAEAQHALEAAPALKAENMLFTPNFAPREEYRQALDLGLNLTVDTLHVLQHWGGDLAGHSLFLRLDPGSGLGHHKMVRTAGANSKFGIPLAELDEALSLCRAHDIEIIGLHAHTGSGIMHPANWHRSLEVLGEAARRIDSVRFVNIGGGLGVPERPDSLPLDLATLNGGLAQLRKKLPPSVELWIEPGRYIAAPAGVLLARVTQTKTKGDQHYVGIATGMNSLIRPALYGAWHEIVNLSRLQEPGSRVSNVVGPICETGDILGLDRLLPDTGEGDVMLIANAGAYGAVMASNYNLRPPASEYTLD